MSMFQVGDRVKSLTTQQGLKMGAVYVIVEKASRWVINGEYTTYFVKPLDAKPNEGALPVGNGHLVLSRVEEGNFELKPTTKGSKRK